MRNSGRSHVNKRRSSRSFNRSAIRTKSPNVRAPMRGGWRL